MKKLITLITLLPLFAVSQSVQVDLGANYAPANKQASGQINIGYLAANGLTAMVYHQLNGQHVPIGYTGALIGYTHRINELPAITIAAGYAIGPGGKQMVNTPVIMLQGYVFRNISLKCSYVDKQFQVGASFSGWLDL